MLSKAERAGLGDQVARHLEGLHAVDGFLHFGIEILNAEAQAIEAEAAQAFPDAAALVTRGSTSMPISASGAKEKRSAAKPKRSSICAGVR